MKSKFSSVLSIFLLYSITAVSQAAQKIQPFSFSSFGISITGTYSEGYLNANTQNGVNILFGLISWGGSVTTSCIPGSSICRIEQIFSFQINRTTTTLRGEKGFESFKTSNGSPPVVVGERNGNITFAVDISQVNEESRSKYERAEWRVENAFILDPNVVKALKLYEGKALMGYIIPAGDYPLYRDGNIVYWTFEKPKLQ